MMEAATYAKFSYKFHNINGLKLHVGHMGPAGGEQIVFLHGFPEFSQSWIEQAEFFAKKGYHVIVPDQRGYNLSEKPVSVKNYALNYLVDDAVALITSLSSVPVTVVGHDWGGGVAWALAQRHPEIVKKLIILNMPHPQVMKENLRKDPTQMLKSWYGTFFQLPFIAEKMCSAFNFKWLELNMVETARSGVFSKEYIAACKKAWNQLSALTGMINWYRAFVCVPQKTDFDISVPALMLWGAKDIFQLFKWLNKVSNAAQKASSLCSVLLLTGCIMKNRYW